MSFSEVGAVLLRKLVYQSCWGHLKDFVGVLKSKDKAERWGCKFARTFAATHINPGLVPYSHKYPQMQVSATLLPDLPVSSATGSLSPCSCRCLSGPVPHSPHPPRDAKGPPYWRGHCETAAGTHLLLDQFACLLVCVPRIMRVWH